MGEDASVSAWVPVKMSEPLVNLFNGVMAPSRALGWWVELDYREEGHSTIYANRFGYLNRKYTELPFQGITSLKVYERWFASCAFHLKRAAGILLATSLTAGVLIGKQHVEGSTELLTKLTS